MKNEMKYPKMWTKKAKNIFMREKQKYKCKNCEYNYTGGALVKQNLDLSKGFLSSCYIIGYQQLKESEPNPLFAGDDEIEKSKVELYSNEEYGII